jgi:hypothetical protein
MTTVVKTEGQHRGEFLVSEGNGHISREAAPVTSGQNLVDGRVVKLGRAEIEVLLLPAARAAA